MKSTKYKWKWYYIRVGGNLDSTRYRAYTSKTPELMISDIKNINSLTPGVFHFSNTLVKR